MLIWRIKTHKDTYMRNCMMRSNKSVNILMNYFVMKDFKTGLNHYLDKFKYTNASTGTLLAESSQFSGENGFFLLNDLHVSLLNECPENEYVVVSASKHVKCTADV